MNLFNYDKNTCSDAITRVRGMGSSVPKKVTGKYIYTVEAIDKANKIIPSNDILIIHDFGSVNDANYVQSSLLKISGASLISSNSSDAAFRASLGYTQDLNFNYNDEKANPGGNVYKKAIFQLTDSILNADVTDAEYYDGSDLNVSKYGVVILLTQKIPVTQTTKNTNVLLNQIIDSSGNVSYLPKIITNIHGDIYNAVVSSSIQVTPNANSGPDDASGNVTRSYTVSVNEYHPNFGPNLQNYINNGGSLILGNNVWQNIKIPGFYYEYIPFVYKENYKYTNKIKINKNVKFKLAGHPLVKGCTTNISLPEQQILNVASEVIVKSEAELIATVLVNGVELPFVAALHQPLLGCRTVAINSYLGLVSESVYLIQILYNAVYWCLKKNL
jgi:hypothetical protein